MRRGGKQKRRPKAALLLKTDILALCFVWRRRVFRDERCGLLWFVSNSFQGKWFQLNQFNPCLYAFFTIRGHPLEIIIKRWIFRGNFALDAPDFLKAFVIFDFSGHSNPPSISICGVQMRGQTYPDSMQILSIIGIVCPLVMCLKFHDTR